MNLLAILIGLLSLLSPGRMPLDIADQLSVLGAEHVNAASLLDPETEPHVSRGPYLQMATPTSIIVRWRTDIPSSSRVVYGSAPSDLRFTVQNDTATVEHTVELTGLVPDTTYFYAFGTSAALLGGSQGELAFQTPPYVGIAQPLRIWLVGDSGWPGTRQRRVRDAYVNYTGSQRTDAWIMLGDNAYVSGTDAEYQAAVFDAYPDMLASTVLWPVYGNHDAIAADASTQSGPYFDIFSLPTAGQAGGIPSGTEAFYAFDLANVHFIVLDSSESIAFQAQRMLDWLAADLTATDQQWIIALWHHPPYSKGSHDSDTESHLIAMRTQVLPILEAGGVDLVLAGHSHDYERSYFLHGHYGPSTTLAPDMILDQGDGRPGGDGAYMKQPGTIEGAAYVVMGSSSSVYPAALNHPAMHTGAELAGSLVLDVDGDQLELIFLTETGQVYDHFTISKGSAVPTPSPTGTALASATPSPTNTLVPTATATPTPTTTATPSPTETAIPTATHSPTATATPSATSSPTPTSTATSNPTQSPTPTTTTSPSATPTATATARPRVPRLYLPLIVRR